MKLVMLKQHAQIRNFSFTFLRDRLICYISSAIFEWSETASDARVSSNDYLQETSRGASWLCENWEERITIT